MTTKIMFINDLHVADRPPLGRAPGYREQVLAKLGEALEAANDAGAEAIILMGDLFHQPRANLVSHGLVRDLISIFSRTYRFPLYTLVGNHDQGPDGMASLHRQPLGVVIESGAVTLLEGPLWVGEVRLVLRHYDAARDLDPTYYALTEEERVYGNRPGPTILAVHGSVVPPGDSRPYPTVSMEDIDLTGIDAVAAAHLHEDVGLIPLGGPKFYINCGSVGRTARTQHNLSRTPAVAMVSFDSGTGEWDFSRYELETARPAEEVFLPMEQAALQETSEEIQAFAAALAQGLQAESAPIEELLAGLTGVSEEVKALVRRFLDDAEDD